MAARRRAWRDAQRELDAQRLVFIDETSASTKMARLRGRSLRGTRCLAAIPHGHWKTTTFVGGLRLGGMTAPMVLDGPMDGPAFLAWVEQMLAPTLEPDDIVVMDNLPAHNRADHLLTTFGREASIVVGVHSVLRESLRSGDA